jgi:hypothetical protein
VKRAPRVDAAFPDALRVDPELLAWLREVESAARLLLDQLADRAARHAPLAVLTEAHQATARFVHDEERGALPRMLQRPADQFRLGTPGYHGFARAVETLFEQGNRAVETQWKADQLQATLREHEARFAGRLPWYWHRLLADARLTDDHVRRLRTPSDVARAAHRAEWLADRLRDLDAALPTDAPRAADGPPPAHPTLAELRVAARLRLDERGMTRQRRAAGDAVRTTTREHRARLVELAGRALPSRTLALQIAERLVRPEHGEHAAATHRDAETAIWLPLLADAGHHLDASTARATWRPPERGPDTAEVPNVTTPLVGVAAPAAPATYVVPIGHGYVLLTPHAESAVRLVDPAAAKLRARAVGRPGEWEAMDLAEGDLAPLFDGFERGVGAWYETAAAARLKVIDGHGDERFAVVDARGRLTRLGTPAWEPSVPGHADAFRVLLPTYLVDPSQEHPTATVPDTAPGHTAGFTTRLVRTPIGGCLVATLRTAEPSTEARRRALAHEHELFRRLAERLDVAADVPHYLCTGRLDERATSGALYRMPLALDDDAAATYWRRIAADDEAVRASLAAVARILVAARRVEFAVGLVHEAMLRPTLRARAAQLSFGVALVQATHATPFGQPVSGSIPVARRSALGFTRLGLRSPLPFIEFGEIADDRFDARAFAVFALDLLSTSPDAELGSWEEMILALQAGRAFRDVGVTTDALVVGLVMRDDARIWAEMERLAGY